MAKLYARLIKDGIKTINDVPEKFKEQVQAILETEYKSAKIIDK